MAMNPLRVAVISLMLAASASAQVHVAAAISLKPALEQIAPEYEKQTNQKIELSFGSSGQMLAQIRSGAPIDLFISAANAQVDQLIAEGLADSAARTVIAGNTIVLIVPAIAKDPPRSFADLATPRFRRISVGEPSTVPAGQYAMQVLTKLKLADAVRDKLIFGANVRQVLTYVETGEVVAGIVYSTDARESGSKVRVIATADSGTHDPVVYPAILIRSSRQPDAAKMFLQYLHSKAAQTVLVEKGFTLPASSTTGPAQ
jgi:molybdate transport system substrate-binding protein